MSNQSINKAAKMFKENSNLEMLLMLSECDYKTAGEFPIAETIGQLKGAYNLVKRVRKDSGINEEVMNVLIHYHTKRIDMERTYEFMMDIAKAWKEAGVETAEGAMERAREETKRFLAYYKIKDPTNITVFMIQYSDYKYEF